MSLSNLLERPLASPRRRTALLAVLAAALVAGGLAGGAFSPAVARAGALLGLLALAGALVRRRLGARSTRLAIAVEARQPLGREAGLALVAAEGRRFVVGYGPGGVSLLFHLDPAAPAEERCR